MLQAADAIDADALAGEIVDALYARLGDDIKGRLAQGDQDAL